MTFTELLATLRERNVQLWADGDRLGYRAAPGAMTAELLESLRRHKHDLMAFLAEAQAADRATRPLRPVARDRDLPLSPSQDLLWRLERLSNGGPLYNIAVVLWLDGRIDVEALRRSFQEIVSRHEVLRTKFAVRGGQPVQVIEPPTRFDLPVVDLRCLAEELRAQEASRKIAIEARIPFNLARDLMLRAKLFRLEAARHALFLNVHHIAADGWSLGILYRELVAAYDAFSIGRPPSLPEIPVQFADFGVWQRDGFETEGVDEHIAYWRKRLSGAPPLLTLPTDRPRPASQSFRGAFETARLSTKLLDAVKALAEQEGCSLYMILLAAFQLLLGRCSGQTDVVVGSPIAGRCVVEVEQLIGFFVNTLVLRADLTGPQTFRKFLAQIRNTTLEANAHQDLRFEKLVEELKPARDLAYNPVFQAMFSLDNTLTAPARMGEMQMSVERISSGTSKFDITLFASDTPDGLQLLAEYSTDIFDRSTVRHWLGNYRQILEEAVAFPDTGLVELLSRDVQQSPDLAKS